MYLFQAKTMRRGILKLLVVTYWSQSTQQLNCFVVSWNDLGSYELLFFDACIREAALLSQFGICCFYKRFIIS